MNQRFKAVLFDFDYTLADSSRGVTECINCALQEMTLPVATYEAACRTIGHSLQAALVKLCGQEYENQADEFIRLFKKRADVVMADMTALFGCVPGTMEQLKMNGIRCGIVSTKYRYRIEDILKREGISNLFDFIIGGDDVSQFKPHPEGLQKAIERLGIAPEEILYIGDSTVDAEAAKRAGLPFAAALSGVTEREEFEGYEVCGFLKDVSELAGLCKNIL